MMGLIGVHRGFRRLAFLAVATIAMRRLPLPDAPNVVYMAGKKFGTEVFPHPIRINTRHKASPSHRKTIFEFEPPSGKGRVDYERLVDEIDDLQARFHTLVPTRFVPIALG